MRKRKEGTKEIRMEKKGTKRMTEGKRTIEENNRREIKVGN